MNNDYLQIGYYDMQKLKISKMKRLVMSKVAGNDWFIQINKQ